LCKHPFIGDGKKEVCEKLFFAKGDALNKLLGSARKRPINNVAACSIQGLKLKTGI
jgi:hypothetical protein